MRTALALLVAIAGCGDGKPATWAERLGYPSGRRVLILHADDAGLSEEANQAVRAYLARGEIQSASLMAPAPGFEAMAGWAAANPGLDLGIHLTLNSEWPRYRWGPVASPAAVPGLVDPEGFLWRNVSHTAMRATAREVETEMRAQLARAKRLGFEPSHLDAHMNAVFFRPDYAAAYLEVARESGIPAMVVAWSERLEAGLRRRGLPATEELRAVLDAYPLPKLDHYDALPAGETYEEKRARFFEQVRALPPGLTQLIFHPAVESEALARITDRWQQRVWEARLFSDPAVRAFLEQEGVLFTSWREIMRRFEAAG